MRTGVWIRPDLISDGEWEDTREDTRCRGGDVDYRGIEPSSVSRGLTQVTTNYGSGCVSPRAANTKLGMCESRLRVQQIEVLQGTYYREISVLEGIVQGMEWYERERPHRCNMCGRVLGSK
jgi:hypothetical protein